MPVALLWIVGPFLLMLALMVLAMRRAAVRRDAFESARARGLESEAGLASAMSEAITRLRGQELAQQARYAALEGFLRQLVESLPHGVFVLGLDGNLRVANAEALRWLGLKAPAEGQVLWTLDGTEALKRGADACLAGASRHEVSLVGPGSDGPAVPVTALPLRAPGQEPDGVLYLVHVERVA